MKKLILLLFAASSVWANTIVGGNFFYDSGIVPYNSNTGFNLTLSGGPISSFDVTHGYQQGAKGAYPADYTSGSFSFQPIDPQAIGVIGIQTVFSVVLNGVTYAQGYQAPNGSVLPPDDSVFAVQFSLTPISGTNVLDTTKASTASGLFGVSGTVSATINGVTYTDPFSGDAEFYGTYAPNGLPGTIAPQITETYTFTSAPEPAAVFEMLSGMGCLGLIGLFRHRMLR
jgi:hypothetical protein